MRISLLTTDYLPNIGGVAQHIYELGRALVRMGDDVEIIAPIWSDHPASFFSKPFQEREVAVPTWRIPVCLNRSIKFFSGQITGRLSKRRFTRQAVRRLQESRPDILHWHALDTAGFPAESFDGPRVWTNHTSNFIDGIKTSGGLRHYHKEAGLAHQIICPSEELAELTVGIGIPRKRVHFITNGVDSQRFRPDVSPDLWLERLRLAPGQRLVLCPRRLEKKNGVRYFIEAAIQVLRSGVEDCVFAVAGNFSGPKSDSDEDVVNQMIAVSGFQSHFRLLGRVENREIPGLYAAATLVVMPSLIEATSLSAMEAMATGKAIVSTNVGGLPFLVHHEENGLLVPPADPVVLAGGIKTLLKEENLRQAMGEAGRRRVEQDLDWEAVARQTRAIYKHCFTNRL